MGFNLLLNRKWNLLQHPLVIHSKQQSYQYILQRRNDLLVHKTLPLLLKPDIENLFPNVSSYLPVALLLVEKFNKNMMLQSQSTVFFYSFDILTQEIINGYQPNPIMTWYFCDSDVTWDCGNFCLFCSCPGYKWECMNLYSSIEFYEPYQGDIPMHTLKLTK